MCCNSIKIIISLSYHKYKHIFIFYTHIKRMYSYFIKVNSIIVSYIYSFQMVKVWNLKITSTSAGRDYLWDKRIFLLNFHSKILAVLMLMRFAFINVYQELPCFVGEVFWKHIMFSNTV